jgi:hypothetical protein
VFLPRVRRSRPLATFAWAVLAAARRGGVFYDVPQVSLLMHLKATKPAWPLAARAQQPERVRRIGVLMNAAADDEESQARVAAFRQGLQSLGWTDDRIVTTAHLMLGYLLLAFFAQRPGRWTQTVAPPRADRALEGQTWPKPELACLKAVPSGGSSTASIGS